MMPLLESSLWGGSSVSNIPNRRLNLTYDGGGWSSSYVSIIEDNYRGIILTVEGDSLGLGRISNSPTGYVKNAIKKRQFFIHFPCNDTNETINLFSRELVNRVWQGPNSSLAWSGWKERIHSEQGMMEVRGVFEYSSSSSGIYPIISGPGPGPSGDYRDKTTGFLLGISSGVAGIKVPVHQEGPGFEVFTDSGTTRPAGTYLLIM